MTTNAAPVPAPARAPVSSLGVRVRTFLRAELDVDTVAILLGVVLVTVGLWPVCGRSALIVPGIVLLWLALPTRAPFLAPPDPPRPSPRPTGAARGRMREPDPGTEMAARAWKD